jgi:hypothetical protein
MNCGPLLHKWSLKKCLWVLSRMVMAMVITLILALLMLDLMSEKQSFLAIAVPYGVLFIVNSGLFCDVIMSRVKNICLPLTIWTTVYTTSIVINLGAVVGRINFWIPIASKTAAKYIIYNLNMDPLGHTFNMQSVSILISIFLGLIIALAFLATVFLETEEAENISMNSQGQPPRYASLDRPSNYNNEGYFFNEVIREQPRRIPYRFPCPRPRF